VSEVRLPRRRRSAARTPVVIDPADIPEDASGRVEVLAVRAPADVYDPADRPPDESAAAPPAPSRAVELLLTADGWVAVGVVGALVLVLFLIGMLLTR